jgi:hypothetical protein
MPLLGPDKIPSEGQVSEPAAEPTIVDEPVREVIRPLDADTTTAPGVEDTGYIWDQTYPGDDQGKPPAKLPVAMANRVTEVSDQILFGSAALLAGALPFMLTPAHRDRVRVTLQISTVAEGSVPVYIGSAPDVVPGFSAWQMVTTDPLVFRTRDAIYVAIGAAGEPVTLQWAAELVAEGCGCQ